MVLEKIKICNCENCVKKEKMLTEIVDKLNYDECLTLLRTDSVDSMFGDLVFNKCLDLNPKGTEEFMKGIRKGLRANVSINISDKDLGDLAELFIKSMSKD